MELLPLLAIMNDVAITKSITIFLQDLPFNYSGYLPRSGSARSCGNSFHFLSNSHIVFHGICPVLHSYQQGRNVSLSPKWKQRFHCLPEIAQIHVHWVHDAIHGLRIDYYPFSKRKGILTHGTTERGRLACSCAQSCPTLCDPMDCSLSGFSVHGILQARILEWVAMPSPRDLPDPGIKPSSVSCTGKLVLYH